MKVIVIGGVAAGPKTACRIKRLSPEADVTLIEKGSFLSYAGCGLPYYIADVIDDHDELMCTPVGVIRDVAFFKKVKDFTVRDYTEAVEIDRENQRVKVRSVQDPSNEGEWLDYDRLVLCTGAEAIVPPITGVDKQGVTVLQTIEDADRIKASFSDQPIQNVVIVGGGLIGLEMAESVVERGNHATVIEMQDQVLNMLDPEMAGVLQKHLAAKGVKLLTGTAVQAIEGGESVEKVVTDQGELPADMVIMAVGVRPRVGLAKNAGLGIGPFGGIVVNEKMETSDPAILAAGDCAESKNLVTGGPTYVPLGSTANKQGRVAAATVVGREDRFPGVLGSAVCKVFDFTVARTGLSETQAIDAGYDAVSVIVPGPDKPHFMPDAAVLFLKVIADRKSRRLLGIQAVGPGEGDKRGDAAAMAITAGMTVDQVAQADLCYAPPYSPAMDNLLTACNVLRNKLDGLYQGVTCHDVLQWQAEGRDFTLLDVRSPAEHEEVRIEGSTLIPLGALRGRIQEIPRDKPVVAFCKISLRGYEAALILQQAGYENVSVMEGGVVVWPGKTLSGK